VKFSYQKMSLLLVDSVSMCTDTLEDYLKDFQFFRVWTARNVEEALKILQEKPVKLMITAWRMVPRSGFQLVELVRKNPRLADLPILMMMDRKDKHVQEKGDALQVTGYINLPLEAKAVRAKVEEVLAQFIDEDQEEFLGHMHKARVAMRKGDLVTAEKAYRAALAVKAEEDTLVGLGNLLKDKKDFPGAEKCFMGALKLNPKSLRAFLGLAEVYQISGRLEDAMKVLAAASAACKKLKESGFVQAGILFFMGEVELQLKHLKEALGYFDQAASLTPEDAKLQTRIGDTLAKEGYHSESESFYQRALEIDPELAHVYNRLAISYRRQGKYDLALNLYRKALTFHPRDENLFYNIARTQWDMNELKQASETLGQALQINPEFKEAKLLLDAVLNKMGFQVSEDGTVPEPPGDIS